MLEKLTERQREMALFVRRGLTDSEIAKQTNISVSTVKSHLKHVYRVLAVSNRTELAGLAEWRAVEAGQENLSAIEGLWISRFEYKAFRSALGKFVSGVQYNLEYLSPSVGKGFFNYEGENLFGISGGGTEYFHDLKCHHVENKLIGIWRNKYGISNIGCFQLMVSNNLHSMEGKHLGNASDNSVQPGSWVWLRVKQRYTDIDRESIYKKWKKAGIDHIERRITEHLEKGSSINIFEFL